MSIRLMLAAAAAGAAALVLLFGVAGFGLVHILVIAAVVLAADNLYSVKFFYIIPIY
jgi:hypothetical protein